MLKRVLMLTVLALLAPATAQAGTISVSGTTILYDADQGSSDQIAVFEVGGDTIRFTRFGGADIQQDAGCRPSDEPEPQTIDCPKGAATRILISLEDEDDIAAVNASVTLPVIFDGGSGADGLFGGGGLDTFNGGPGNDNIVARDGQAESQVDCGDGFDTAITDDSDTRISCEDVEGDADGDGVRVPADCDDTRPTIRPGAVDVPDNGVDEDCSGVDAINADRDRDGVPRPQDCNDGDAAIRPGLAEALGNDVDENCDGRIDPFPPITGGISHAWARRGSGTANLRLVAKRFPRNTAIVMRCDGRRCPFDVVRRRVASRGRSVNLHRPFRNRALRRGTEIEVRVTIANRIGRVMRYTIGRPGAAPDVEFLCLPPGGRPAGC
jgi:hypothetical protein